MRNTEVNKKIIVIVGPTASGKSALAIRLAKKFGGEVISADSRQIYRGLEIGSGAVSKREIGGIPHHLISFVNPRRTFTAAEYKKLARKEFGRIWQRGKIPILTGGTGLYVRATVDGLVIPEVKPNQELRKELEKKGIAELSKMLQNKDRRRWEEVDKKNPRRLIRALEIAKTLGRVPEPKMESLEAETLFIGLTTGREELARSIRRRIERMIGSGLIKETEKLRRAGLGEKRIREFGFEYADTLDFLDRKIASRAELAERIFKDTLKYAKRQMTWFKKDSRIMWVNRPSEAVKLARSFIKHR